ncbi:MAG: Mitochondrial mRNA-processing protein C-terminal [Acidimicrobiaceae bacterium]
MRAWVGGAVGRGSRGRSPLARAISGNDKRPVLSAAVMGSLIKKRRKRMRKKKHKKMLKRTRWQRRAGK